MYTCKLLSHILLTFFFSIFYTLWYQFGQWSLFSLLYTLLSSLMNSKQTKRTNKMKLGTNTQSLDKMTCKYVLLIKLRSIVNSVVFVAFVDLSDCACVSVCVFSCVRKIYFVKCLLFKLRKRVKHVWQANIL